MESEEVVIKLPADEGLVLSDWLIAYRRPTSAASSTTLPCGLPLHRNAGALDKTLPAIFARTTPERLAAARQRLSSNIAQE